MKSAPGPLNDTGGEAHPADAHVIDAHLIERYQAGDEAAFVSLVRRWEDSVYRIAFRVIGDCSLAEDVRQEVFVRLFRKPDCVHRPDRFASWLRRSVVNEAINVLRRNRRTSDLIRRSVEQGKPEASFAPVDGLVQSEESIILATALEVLTPDQRALLSLRFDEDLSFSAIAEITGRPASTIKSQVAQAIRKLRGRLSE